MKKQTYVIESEYGDIYIEKKAVDVVSSGKQPASITQDADLLRVEKSFEGAMANVGVIYKSMQDILNQVSPTEFGLEIGVKLNLKTGFFVVSTGSEVEFKINLKWAKPQGSKENHGKEDIA